MCKWKVQVETADFSDFVGQDCSRIECSLDLLRFIIGYLAFRVIEANKWGRGKLRVKLRGHRGGVVVNLRKGVSVRWLRFMALPSSMLCICVKSSLVKVCLVRCTVITGSICVEKWCELVDVLMCSKVILCNSRCHPWSVLLKLHLNEEVKQYGL